MVNSSIFEGFLGYSAHVAPSESGFEVLILARGCHGRSGLVPHPGGGGWREQGGADPLQTTTLCRPQAPTRKEGGRDFRTNSASHTPWPWGLFVVPPGGGRSRLPLPGSRVGSCPDTAVTHSNVALVCVMSHSCWSTRGFVHRIWGSGGAHSAAFPCCHVRFMALFRPGPVPRRGSISTSSDCCWSFTGRHSPWLWAGQGLMVQGTTGLSLTVTLDKGWSDRTRGTGFKVNKDRVRWDILEKLFPMR